MSCNPQKVTTLALSEVGYLEKASAASLDDKTANAGDANITKYARDLDKVGFYNGKKQGIAWCDVFVDWCFYKAYGLSAALKLTFQPLGKRNCGAGCKYSRQYYEQKGRFFSSPQVGDQIFFGTHGSETHTGLVYKVDGSRVYTVEGNTSGANGVVANGGGVCKKSYSLSYERIVGYGRPDFDSVTDGNADSAASSSEADYPATDSAASADSKESISEKRTIIITTSGVNARVGDSTKYGTVGKLKKGEVIEYVATAPNGWYAGRWKSRIVWVSPNYSTLSA